MTNVKFSLCLIKLKATKA